MAILRQSPYFSIITPSYNRANFLYKTINSVINQTFQDWEYIIVDDASTDNSFEIINSFHDERIIYIKNEINIERCDSRNKGIDIAKGKYICFLDSDDEYLDNHLEVLHKYIREHEEKIALFYTSSMQEINGGEVHKREKLHFDEAHKFEYIMSYTFNPTSVAIHRNILNEYKFDALLYCLEDMDLCLRIAIKYPIIQIPEYTILIHFHEGTFTLGDYERFSKELRNFKYIFKKKELRNVLPVRERKMLLSKTHYKLALRYEQEKNYLKMYNSIVKSFILYPAGYNKNTNKPMLIMFLYHIPIIGSIIKNSLRLIKYY